LALGWRPLGAVLHSSNEPGELSQWLCHDDSTINIVLDIIIIIIIIIPSCGVCVSVTFVHSVKTNKDIIRNFLPSGSHTILVFSISNGMVIFRREPPKGGVECRWGRQKSRFWANIWLQCVLLTLLPARCCQYDVVGPPTRRLWRFAGIVSGGVCWWRERTAKCWWRYNKDNRTSFNCTQW